MFWVKVPAGVPPSPTAAEGAILRAQDRGPVNVFVRPSGQGMVSNLRAEVCVGGAIFRGGRLLLLRRNNNLVSFPGIWDSPGGRVKTGEDLTTALRRELMEETGFSAKVGSPFYAATFDRRGRGAKRIRSVVVEFLCTGPSREPPRVNPSEASEFAWVRFKDVPKYRTTPLVNKIRRAAFASQRRGRRGTET